jgi:hypothetical protein
MVPPRLAIKSVNLEGLEGVEGGDIVSQAGLHRAIAVTHHDQPPQASTLLSEHLE